MNNAIVCLTRGYKDFHKYNTLIKRNRAISKLFGNKYAVVIFHEGNISDEAQRHIINNSDLLTIQFRNISHCWTGGYEGMCRFHAFDIWNECKEFDNILRIDEDCELKTFKDNPFDQQGENVYLLSVYWDESHSETNATLPQFIENLTGVSKDIFYNRKYPYTNVSLSNVQFWLQSEINNILKQIATSPEQRKNRWGDLPMLGSLLNIYAQGKVGCMEGLEYYHESHNNTIICNGLD